MIDLPPQAWVANIFIIFDLGTKQTRAIVDNLSRETFQTFCFIPAQAMLK
jgi:hypothetical protein